MLTNLELAVNGFSTSACPSSKAFRVSGWCPLNRVTLKVVAGGGDFNGLLDHAHFRYLLVTFIQCKHDARLQEV